MFKANVSRVTKRSRPRLAIVAAAAVAISSAIVTQASPVSAAPGDTVQILSFNDFHGHIDPVPTGQSTISSAGRRPVAASTLAQTDQAARRQ